MKKSFKIKTVANNTYDVNISINKSSNSVTNHFDYSKVPLGELANASKLVNDGIYKIIQEETLDVKHKIFLAKPAVYDKIKPIKYPVIPKKVQSYIYYLTVKNAALASKDYKKGSI